MIAFSARSFEMQAASRTALLHQECGLPQMYHRIPLRMLSSLKLMRLSMQLL